MAHRLLLLFKILNVVCFSPVCSFFSPQYWKWTLHPQHRHYLFPFLISLGLEFTEFSTRSHLWLQEGGNGKKVRGGDQDNSGKRQAFTSYCVLNAVVLFFFDTQIVSIDFIDRFIDCFYINFCTNILLQCFLRTSDRDILNLCGGGQLVGRGKSQF